MPGSRVTMRRCTARAALTSASLAGKPSATAAVVPTKSKNQCGLRATLSMAAIASGDKYLCRRWLKSAPV